MTDNNETTDLSVEKDDEYQIGSLQMQSAYLTTQQFDEIYIEHDGTEYVVEETDDGIELIPEAREE